MLRLVIRVSDYLSLFTSSSIVVVLIVKVEAKYKNMKETYYKVYYNIKLLRETKGEKQETLARALGISQSAYSRIESGESDISLKHILKLCEFYSMEPENFLTWQPPPPPF